MNARLLLLTCAVLAVSSPSLAAGITDYDGRYSGTISCGAMPDGVLPGDTPLRTRFSLEISNGQGYYEQHAYKANSNNPIGISELGVGTVSPGGDVSLTGSAVATGAEATRTGEWGYEAGYRGRFNGKNLQLSGAQLWLLPVTRAVYTRPCTITLAPAPPAK